MFLSKDILLSRLSDEVVYLRSQNNMLLERLMVLTDRNAYKEMQYQQSNRNKEVAEIEKYRGMTSDMIKEQESKEKKENEIVAIQLKQMMTGSD